MVINEIVTKQKCQILVIDFAKLYLSFIPFLREIQRSCKNDETMMVINEIATK